MERIFKYVINNDEMMMVSITENLHKIRQQINELASQCSRDANSIELIAVSKTKTIEMINEAIGAGQFAFGENYVQEAIDKITYFNEKPFPLTWHVIGPLQSNKTKLVAEHFDWVHTIDRLKIAQRLSEQRPHILPKLNLLIQINISEELTKSGILPHELPALAKQISVLPNVTLRGLMAIPEIEDDESKQLAVFTKMQQLLEKLKLNHPSVDTLSMGMSNDINSAIIAGSTMVRIGSAIFGAR